MDSLILYKGHNLTEVSSRRIERNLYKERNFKSWQAIDVPRMHGPHSSSFTTTIPQKLHIYCKVTISWVTTASRGVDRHRLEWAAFILTYLGLWRQHFSQIRWWSWLCTKLHCVTFQKPVIFMLTPVRNADVTFRPWRCGQCGPQNLVGAKLCAILRVTS